MKMRALLAAVVAMVLMSAGAASAGTVTVTGNYSVSATGSGTYTGNKPGLTDDLPGTFSQAVTGTTVTTNFFTAAPTGSCGGTWNICGGTNIDTGPITVTLTNLSDGSGTAPNVTVSGTYEANYNNTTDYIDWTGAVSGVLTVPVDFSNGAVVDLLFYNQSDWDITPKIGFDLVDGPTATPLPPALSLFGGGLGMIGLLGWRRKRKAVAIAA
jgi:hypothetical protein